MNDLRGEHAFFRALDRSDLAVLAVSGVLRRKGRAVVLPPLKKDRGPDDGDLTVLTPEGPYGVEVKWMTIDFQSLAAFPHPRIIVDACYHFDDLPAQPRFYFICNDSLTLALVIEVAKTRDQWDRYLGGHTDPLMEGKRWYYRAPHECWREQPLS